MNILKFKASANDPRRKQKWENDYDPFAKCTRELKLSSTTFSNERVAMNQSTYNRLCDLIVRVVLSLAATSSLHTQAADALHWWRVQKMQHFLTKNMKIKGKTT